MKLTRVKKEESYRYGILLERKAFLVTVAEEVGVEATGVVVPLPGSNPRDLEALFGLRDGQHFILDTAV